MIVEFCGKDMNSKGFSGPRVAVHIGNTFF